MTLDMNDSLLVTLSQLEIFTQAAHGLNFVGRTRKERYAWTEKLLQRFWYFSTGKKNRSIIKTYARKMTGYSDAQMTRLIGKMKKTRHIVVPDSANRSTFPTRYTSADVALLIATDDAHGRLSGKATKEIFRRQFAVFDDERFIRLKEISTSHLYNLRGKRQYVSLAGTFTRTNPTAVPIGERRKPFPDGKPGYIRVDSVHQGDLDKEKGVYHVNLVDEVTQWELVGCVEGISEHFLAPLLETLLAQFPFKVIGFHSDNGSEYINYVVAKLLNKLSIEQTKSRARRSNDQALVEGKNGSVVRKHMGYIHIPKKYASPINDFYQGYFIPYINFHRPSGYATTVADAKGKEKKTYNLYETPYEHFKKLPQSETYLQSGATFAGLDALAYAMSDNACATLMQEAKYQLFKSFRDRPVPHLGLIRGLE
jgi:hypothetical protein